MLSALGCLPSSFILRVAGWLTHALCTCLQLIFIMRVAGQLPISALVLQLNCILRAAAGQHVYSQIMRTRRIYSCSVGLVMRVTSQLLVCAVE